MQSGSRHDSGREGRLCDAVCDWDGGCPIKNVICGCPHGKNCRPKCILFPPFSYLVAPPPLPPLQELQLLPQALVPAQAAHAYQGRHDATSSLNFPPKSISGISQMNTSAPSLTSLFTVSLLSPSTRAKWGRHCTRRISASLALTLRRRDRLLIMNFSEVEEFDILLF